MLVTHLLVAGCEWVAFKPPPPLCVGAGMSSIFLSRASWHNSRSVSTMISGTYRDFITMSGSTQMSNAFRTVMAIAINLTGISDYCRGDAWNYASTPPYAYTQWRFAKYGTTLPTPHKVQIFKKPIGDGIHTFIGSSMLISFTSITVFVSRVLTRSYQATDLTISLT